MEKDNLRYINMYPKMIFSTFAKLSKKLTFLAHPDRQAYMYVSMGKICSFIGIFRKHLMDDPYT